MSGEDALPPNVAVGERFRVGRVVARSLAIWGRELPLLLALALVVHAPRVVAVECLELAMPELPRVTSDDMDSLRERLEPWLWRAVPIQIASALLQALFTDLSLALVIFAVCARLRGRRAVFRESVRGGVSRLLPVLRVSLCLFLLQGTLFWGLALLFWLLILAGAWETVVGLQWFPWPLLIALLLSPFWVAVPAAVFEPGKLLRTSWRLTSGHRLAVCSILVLLFAVDWGSIRLIVLAWTEPPRLAAKAIWWTQDLLVVSLTAVFAAVGYHALRLEKDGVDVSTLEEVFA